MPVCAGVFHCSGDGRKLNWLLVRRVPGARRCVVFFPGDISDFAAGDARFPQYSLEALLWVMSLKYPEDDIVIVKPRIMEQFFAIYVNFLLVDGMGNPRPLVSKADDEAAVEDRADGGETITLGSESGAAEGKEDSNDAPTKGGTATFLIPPPPAVEHLRKLLQSASAQMDEALPSRLVLVGFSKGAVVLNALLRESSEAEFWECVDAVHFVDAGLVVPGMIFPTTQPELEVLSGVTREGFTIWMHSTPRQMQDESRPFIRVEAEEFVERCKAVGIRVELRSYGSREPPSLEGHFDCVRCFHTGIAGAAEHGDTHFGFFGEWGQVASAMED